METKYPFTTAGMEGLTAELYALPQPHLLIKSNALKSDFKLFMNDHFDFSASQQNDLAQLSASDAVYLGAISGYKLEHRLPIVLIKPERPASRSEEEDDYYKIVRTDDETEIEEEEEDEGGDGGNDGGGEGRKTKSRERVTGTLTIEIIYRPK